MPDPNARVRGALGDTPIDDQRHRLPPLPAPPPIDSAPPITPIGLSDDERLCLLTRLAKPITLRLLPAGAPFPARAVWRAAYALGLEWGELDLFRWYGADGASLFWVHALGGPGYFLPERVAEGEGIAGLALSFEPPLSPDPAAVLDRMALALAFFRERLCGRPVAPDGQELDGETLARERERVQDIAEELRRLGLPPGSPAARQVF